MNILDPQQQFKYEFISGISLSNELHRLNRVNTNIDTNKEHQVNPNKYNLKPNQLSSVTINEPLNNKQLEIIGSEFGSKISSNTANQQLLIKNSNSFILPKHKLTRINQTMLQLPKRTTFLTPRKTRENLLSRTWTSHVPFTSEQKTSDKLNISPPQRRANTSTDNADDKSIMVQQTSTDLTINSPITVLKKMPTNNNKLLSPRSSKKSHPSTITLGRETTSFKLPTLIKRTPASITRPIPSAYIQDSSRVHVASTTNINRPVLQPTPIIPIYKPRRSVTLYTTQQHLPLIKERVIKANLSQRASFKCKSPPPYRPDSSISRSTTAVISNSQLQTKTHNPLKHMDVSLLLNEATRNRLKRLFNQLDTDKDGHLTYPQVQKCLPSNLPRAQETFFRVLYDITSETTFFGLQEFYATAVLVDMISQQDSNIWNTLLDDVDFNYYRDDILELLEEFDSRVSPITSTINYDSLIALIMHRTTNGKYENITKELDNINPLIKTMKLTRLDFIALIPILIYIESRFDHGKSLFRFRDNSILDAHMQKALLI